MCFEINKFRSIIRYNKYFILNFKLDGLGNVSILFIGLILRGKHKAPC